VEIIDRHDLDEKADAIAGLVRSWITLRDAR
jgi:hypothetical protein